MVKQAGSDREKRVEWDDHLKHRAGFIFSCVSITCIKLQGSILSPLFSPIAERKRGSTPKMKNYQNTIPKFRGLYKRARGMLRSWGAFAVPFLQNIRYTSTTNVVIRNKDSENVSEYFNTHQSGTLPTSEARGPAGASFYCWSDRVLGAGRQGST